MSAYALIAGSDAEDTATYKSIVTEAGLDAVPLVHRFIPSPGWKGHIELT